MSFHIAEAMGISPGNLYLHFRNKDEIINAISYVLWSLWLVVIGVVLFSV